MAHHCSRDAIAPPELLVTPQPGTNGYVSTWGALCSGCQPPAAVA
ncbi:hypothetical protein [Demequina activiva]|nr:hypothetical protein [Demequina activiva]